MYEDYLTGDYDNITLTTEGFCMEPEHAGELVQSWLMQRIRYNDQEALKGFTDSIEEFAEGFYCDDIKEIVDFIKLKADKMSKDYEYFQDYCTE